jgi:hypothetical protein
MWKLLEVGLDGIYCPLLLLNKKKYAALSVTERDGVITKVNRFIRLEFMLSRPLSRVVKAKVGSISIPVIPNARYVPSLLCH